MDNTLNTNQLNSTGSGTGVTMPAEAKGMFGPDSVGSTGATGVTTPVMKPKKTGLIIGMIGGGVAIVGVAIVVVILLLGGKVDYVATYDALKPLEASMDDLDYGDCYDLHNDLGDEDVSKASYSQYVSGCVAEFAALESATKEFGKSSGAKHDKAIKSDFETFETALKDVYASKSDLEKQLSLYTALHEFYLIIEEADSSDTKSLETAVVSASKVLQDTKNSELATFADGFRERGLAYVRAIEEYNNSTSYSSSLYAEVRAKMNDFTDYIDDADLEYGLDVEKLNDLSDAYDKLSRTVRDAYYDNI